MVRVIISVLVVAILLPAFLLGCNNTDNAEGENSMMPKATMPCDLCPGLILGARLPVREYRWCGPYPGWLFRGHK
jgi:hypothetical protein